MRETDKSHPAVSIMLLSKKNPKQKYSELQESSTTRKIKYSYSIRRRSSFAQIHKELGIYSQAVADWRSYAPDVLIEHIVLYTQKLGREVYDRTAETLLGLIESWIEPGTTVKPDCWKSYERLSERGYHHLIVNHSLEFVDSETGAHTNTIEELHLASLQSFLA
ncbi:putative transposase-like protein [Trichonephila clavipes]|nr:putative transposase-like protein [Trichonephila clavipes]